MADIQNGDYIVSSKIESQEQLDEIRDIIEKEFGLKLRPGLGRNLAYPYLCFANVRQYEGTAGTAALGGEDNFKKLKPKGEWEPQDILYYRYGEKAKVNGALYAAHQAIIQAVDEGNYVLAKVLSEALDFYKDH